MHINEHELLPWLLHTQSITEQLKQKTGEARLELLKQTIRPSNWWERHKLGVNNDIFAREIMMFSHQEACWYARTLIPKNTLDSHKLTFDRLNQEALGDIIYNNPGIERVYMSHFLIDSDCLEFYWLPEYVRHVRGLFWTRLSHFEVQKKNVFFLLEIFLPGLYKWL